MRHGIHETAEPHGGSPACGSSSGLQNPPWRVQLLAIVAVAAIGSDALAQEQPAARIARLVERLGASSYADRVDADQQLAGLGSLPREQLELAARSDDAEVAARARDLLRRIAIDDLWQPGRVTYQAEDTPAAEVLSTIRDQTGNRILFGDRYGGFREAPVQLQADNALYWEVIDDFCRKTKNHVRPHYDTRDPGLALVSGEPGANPVAYAGPVRATVTGALRTFSDEFDYKRLTSKQNHLFRINLELLWEDRLRIVAYRSHAQVSEALTDTGERVDAVNGSHGSWNVASSGSRQVAMELKLEPPPTTAARFAVLALEWPVAAVGDFTTVETSELVVGTMIEQDDLQLSIDSIEAKDGSKHTLTVSLLRDRPVPDPPESLFQENRFELFDAQQRPLRLTEQTNGLEGRAVRSKLVFLQSSTEGPPAMLRVTYPRLRSERNLSIVLRDVPLPTARPQ